MSYVVDARNRRIGRVVGSEVTHRWLYQGQLRPVAELDAAGSVISRFVYGVRSVAPEYMIRGGITYRLVTDHLGSVRLVVDIDSGAIAQQLDYDPWGRVVTDTNPGFQPFGYAGGIHDSLTALVRFGLRDYDPFIGRWLAKDPLGIAAGDTNLFTYVSNDPINFVDPFGLITVKADGENIRVHKSDVDPWPSSPHGHILGTSQKVNVYTGEIFDKVTRKLVGKLSKQGLATLTARLKKAGFIGAMLAFGATAAEAATMGCDSQAIENQAIALAAGFAGGYAGSAVGGKIGAAMGTLIAPGLGTAIGAVAGSTLGGIIGASYGESAAKTLFQ